jgi:hypothetical protein
VAPEVSEEFDILVHAEELAHDLDGEDFGVGELWGGAALAQWSPVLNSVVYEAEDGHDEGAKIHKKTSATSLWCYWADTERREGFSLAQVLKETCTRGYPGAKRGPADDRHQSRRPHKDMVGLIDSGAFS